MAKKKNRNGDGKAAYDAKRKRERELIAGRDRGAKHLSLKATKAKAKAKVKVKVKQLIAALGNSSESGEFTPCIPPHLFGVPATDLPSAATLGIARGAVDARRMARERCGPVPDDIVHPQMRTAYLSLLDFLVFLIGAPSHEDGTRKNLAAYESAVMMQDPEQQSLLLRGHNPSLLWMLAAAVGRYEGVRQTYQDFYDRHPFLTVDPTKPLWQFARHADMSVVTALMSNRLEQSADMIADVIACGDFNAAAQKLIALVKAQTPRHRAAQRRLARAGKIHSPQPS